MVYTVISKRLKRRRKGQQLSKYIFVDVDEKGIPLGIEILFVSRHLDMKDLTTVTLNIGKAAELVGAGL